MHPEPPGPAGALPLLAEKNPKPGARGRPGPALILILLWLAAWPTWAGALRESPPPAAATDSAAELAGAPERAGAWKLAGAWKSAGAIDAFGSGLAYCPAPLTGEPPAHSTVVTNCTRQGVQAALDGGGPITFACGPGPVTIPIDQTLVVTVDALLDGGGRVTLDGGGQARILEKPWTAAPVTLTLQNIRLAHGRAAAGSDLNVSAGGAVTLGHPGSRLHIINSTFVDNQTTSIHEPDNQGGAIFVHNAHEAIIVGSVFENNRAGNGGAIGSIATGLVMVNNRFSHNQAVDDSPGGIVRGYGGAIHLDGVRNSYNPDGRRTFQVCGSLFESNQAVRGGGAVGAVLSDGYDTLASFTRSTFVDNEVTGLDGSFGQGGAIYHVEDDHAGGRNEDNLAISHTTFRGNRAGRQGGAVWMHVLGRARVENSTFAHNQTTAPFNTVGQGGAMVVTLGVVDVTNSTFAYNHAAYQAGALHGGGSGDPDRVVTLHHTIFLHNTLNEQWLPSPTEWQGYHTNRPMNDGGQNIQHPRFKPTYGNEVNNNIVPAPIYADPRLQPLADNGGDNETMALSAGSPAIDAGGAGCLPLDQRFAARVGPCDIGAYEFGGAPPDAHRLALAVRVTDLGDTLPYTDTVAVELTLANRDTAPVAGVVLTTTLPGALAFQAWVQPEGAVVAGPLVQWGPDSLPAGATVTVIFTAAIQAAAGTPITVTAGFRADGGEAGQAATGFVAGQPPQQRRWLPVVGRP